MHPVVRVGVTRGDDGYEIDTGLMSCVTLCEILSLESVTSRFTQLLARIRPTPSNIFG